MKDIYPEEHRRWNSEDEMLSEFARNASNILIKENSKDEIKAWIHIKELNVPAGEIHGVVNGSKMILKVFSDELMQEVLNQFSNGRSLIYGRIYQGSLIQIIYYLPERKEELSKSKRAIYYTLPQTYKPTITQQLTQARTLEDRVSNAVNLILLSNKKSGDD